MVMHAIGELQKDVKMQDDPLSPDADLQAVNDLRYLEHESNDPSACVNEPVQAGPRHADFTSASSIRTKNYARGPSHEPH